MDEPQAPTQFAQTVPAFCREASISRGMFYKLRRRSLKEGKGDPLRKLGKKAIVFPEVARAWLRSMTTDADLDTAAYARRARGNSASATA